MSRLLDTLAYLQPYVTGLLVAVLILMLSSGCATTGADSAGRTRDFATTGATTAAGAYVGAKEGNGKSKNAAVGAAVGFVAGETINYFSNKAQREAFLAGYEKGQSNAVKQQYWIARENQRSHEGDGYEESLYEISVPQSDRDGVRREPTTRVIRVVMPRKESGS
ncbi:YMGG-like glycine zipper-containing protein [Opitutus terrae]|uniref:YMGG-like Gly-zipper domain-containing protein n=1 Tax=Opitutus terrae (strain DSM 11246 / JCM 15787 / PB90-1) TaxID=452637 RepID=B1ZPG8_OPITP|nr:YMGG-like glycine zipper-containing protein [Opitutus terrae]ACB74487.1 hypothetical protein Oter_1201 [Opitutus terrae PB90-1]